MFLSGVIPIKKTFFGFFLLTVFIFAVVAEGLAIELPLIPVDKPTGGQDWVVATDGSGDFLNIEEADASNLVEPGDTVKIKQGTYYVDSLDKSGSPGNEVVWEAYGDGLVSIIPAGDPIAKGKGISISASYIIIDGGEQRQIVIDGSNCYSDGSATIAVLHIQKWEEMSAGVTMRRMVIEKIGGPLPDPVVEGEGANGGALLVKTSNFRFFNNIVRNSLGMALYLYGENLEVRNNHFHDLYSTAMQVNPHTDYPPGYSNHSGYWITDEAHLSGNLIVNVGRGRPKYGIVLMSSTDTDRNVYVYNNIIADCYGGIKRNPGGADARIKVFNNTIYNNDHLGFYFKKAEPGDVRLFNNISCNNGFNDEFYQTFYLENNLLLGTESFPGFDSTDQSSPAFLKLIDSDLTVNQGTAWSTIVAGTQFRDLFAIADDTGDIMAIDISGNLRDDSTIDIGAWEYSSDQPEAEPEPEPEQDNETPTTPGSGSGGSGCFIETTCCHVAQ